MALLLPYSAGAMLSTSSRGPLAPCRIDASSSTTEHAISVFHSRRVFRPAARRLVGLWSNTPKGVTDGKTQTRQKPLRFQLVICQAVEYVRGQKRIAIIRAEAYG
jgi:hypothetical protein